MMLFLKSTLCYSRKTLGVITKCFFKFFAKLSNGGLGVQLGDHKVSDRLGSPELDTLKHLGSRLHRMKRRLSHRATKSQLSLTGLQARCRAESWTKHTAEDRLSLSVHRHTFWRAASGCTRTHILSKKFVIKVTGLWPGIDMGTLGFVSVRSTL